jgi:hypothetical protein
MATNPLLYPALSELSLIVYRDVKDGTAKTNPVPYLPIPNQIASIFIVFGILGSLPERFNRVSTLMGWGFVIATALNLYTPGAKVVTTKKAAATQPAAA